MWRLSLILLVFIGSAGAADPWSTYRGNPQRTGNTDNQPGPAEPKVLWSAPAQDSFIAAPVVHGDRLYLSGLGAFNVASFAAYPAGGGKPLWSKTTPYLKLPTVSSPAVADNLLVFGDGMHQTDGATLHGVALDSGRPFWQLPVPGTLVHLEGAPTIANGKVYIGGGAAGVLCVDPSQLTLNGQPTDPAAAKKLLDEKWKELQAKYEADKKKDPDFAVPPNEDQLPKLTPKLAWQQGQQKWHVDAPVNVVNGKVLVCSAFLDKEQVGDRAVYCLDAASGTQLWRRELVFNPWGGAAVQGDTVVVAGSSINYDPDVLKGAKGEIVALNLADGSVKWRKELPGGVVGGVALTADLVLSAATDGKVRAFGLANGDRRWIYETGVGCFAPPAIAGNTAYVGDLKGVIHALDLTGKPLWKLDLGGDPVNAPGMIYGGPTVSGGRVFVATCNIAGPNRTKPTAIVCIGAK